MEPKMAPNVPELEPYDDDEFEQLFANMLGGAPTIDRTGADGAEDGAVAPDPSAARNQRHAEPAGCCTYSCGRPRRPDQQDHVRWAVDGQLSLADSDGGLFILCDAPRMFLLVIAKPSTAQG